MGIINKEAQDLRVGDIYFDCVNRKWREIKRVFSDVLHCKNGGVAIWVDCKGGNTFAYNPYRIFKVKQN